MRILTITSEWPTEDNPNQVPFIVDEIKALQGIGHEITVFHFRGNRSIRNYANAWKKLRKQFIFSEFDLIHAQFGQSALLAFSCKRPLVITFRGSDLHGFIGPKGELTVQGVTLRYISRLLAYQADERIIVSKSLAKYLPHGLSYHVIPGGINSSIFTPIPKEDARILLGLPINKKIVLFPSDPARPVKRFALARAAVEEVRKNMDVDLLTLGNVKHELIPWYMNAADAMVFTSSNEGSPNVVKEALACNLPVVSINVGDVAENISQIEECFLCKNDSPSEIAYGLENVLINGKRITGYQLDTKFDITNSVLKINEVYHSAIKNFNSRIHLKN